MSGVKQLFWAAFYAASLMVGQRAQADVFGSGANSFSIDFVTVGSPGNLPDTTGIPVVAGAVAYSYRIAEFEISEAMIAKANAVGSLGITTDSRGPNKPATSVTWYEAAKFVNWLNTSTGNHSAYKFDGSGNFEQWQPSDPGYLPGILFRNSLAKYVLPSVDEWYKAAFYDPSMGVYFDYPTGSDSLPTSVASGTAPGTAIFLRVGPADVTQAGGLSPFGTMGQGGNAAEWMETDFRTGNHNPNDGGRAFRGGDFGQFASDTSSTSGLVVIPAIQSSYIGFRVVSIVPEPSSSLFLDTALLLSFGVRKRAATVRRHWHV